MKTLILFFAVLLSGGMATQTKSTAEKSQKIREQIRKDMDSEAVDVGCTMAVEFAAYGRKVVCVMPDGF